MRPSPWMPIIVYATLRFISSGACIGWIRTWLWMPLEQYSYSSLDVASQAHVLSLDTKFHDNKGVSDLTQAVHSGHSITSILEIICFQVVPNLIDLALALGYLWSHFGPYMGLLMLSTVASYLYITTKLVSLRAEKRRDYINGQRKQWNVGYASLENWYTASVGTIVQEYASSITDVTPAFQYDPI